MRVRTWVRCVLATGLGLLNLPVAAQAAEIVWLEGEDAQSTTFNDHSWYCCSDVRTHLLSPGSPDDPDTAGEWLSHFNNDGGTAEATYMFTITEGGSYDIWIRTSSYRVLMTMAVDDNDPIAVDTDHGTREVVNMNWPGIDVRFLGWVRMKDIELDVGVHTLTFEVGEHEDYGGVTHGGIDALTIVNFDWGPAGTIQPSLEPDSPADDDWFVFAPGDPPELEDSVFDLSEYVEAPAGEHGALETDGADFVFADGTPIRFWGVGSTYPGTQALAEQQARMYRMFGVNMVRLHSVEGMIGILQTDEKTGERTLDAEALDELDIWFAALKEAGVYMTFSTFYPHVVTEEDNIPSDIYDDLEDDGEGKSSSGYVTVFSELQDAEWTWLEALLTHTNPYTGLTYAEDPALAVLEMRNEDSVFWHAPLNTISEGSVPNIEARLQHMWMEWLQAKYDDDDALAAAWGEGLQSGDSLENDTMAIYGAWEMYADGPWSGVEDAARMGDFIQFLAETQVEGYAARETQIRDAGFEGVIVSTAWKAGGDSAVAANFWTDSTLDAIDRHTYAGGMTDGSHDIELSEVSQTSHLDEVGSLLFGVAWSQAENQPFLHTEWTMKPPSWWKAEAAPLYAFYGMGLHGWDASYHFSASKAWLRGGWPSQGGYVSETPHYMGQFPALARAVHEGHLTESEPVAARRIHLEDAFTGFDSLTQPLEAGGWDPAAGEDTLEVPAEVFAFGRITLDVGEDVDDAERIAWDDIIDADGVITSVTGELSWDTTRRVVVADTPSTQAIIGFADSQTHDLTDFEVYVESEFVSLIFTALDGEPLSTTGRVLITAMAKDQQFGAEYSADGTTLDAMGGPPLMLEPVKAFITVKREAEIGSPIIGVTPLDEYGVPRDAAVDVLDNAFRIDGTYAASHYLLELTVADSADTGDGDGKDGWCGCAIGASRTSGWTFLLALLGLVGLRRKR